MWNTLEEFAKWYEDEGFPIRPPQHNSIFRTNNASALVLYREGQFQVELYIADEGQGTPEHAHPGVNSVIVFLAGQGNTTINGQTIADPSPFFDKVNADGTSVLFKQKLFLNPNDTHGLVTYSQGFAFLSIEQWPEGVSPSSVTVHWSGETTGNIHNETIRKTKENK